MADGQNLATQRVWRRRTERFGRGWSGDAGAWVDVAQPMLSRG